jgi:hypothetical protein
MNFLELSLAGAAPEHLSEGRTCAGLTTTTGSEAPAGAAATTVSEPPVASTGIRSGPASPCARRIPPDLCHRARQQRSRPPAERERRADPSTRRSRHRSFPSFPFLAQPALAAQASVRGRWTNGGATRLRDGLQGPRTSRRLLRYRALNPIRRRANQVTRTRREGVRFRSIQIVLARQRAEPSIRRGRYPQREHYFRISTVTRRLSWRPSGLSEPSG